MKIVGHRGAPLVAPENTIAGFLAAIALGADGVELDVQTTSDGHLAVIHDVMLERTTSGTGAICRSPWSSLSTLDAGSWFSESFAGEPIPQLADVLDLEGLELEIEVKGYGVEFATDVVDLVRARGALDRVEFTGSNLPLLAVIKSMEPAARIGLFTPAKAPWHDDDTFEHSIIGFASTSGADVVHVAAANITRRIVDRLHHLGFVVQANSAESSIDVSRAIEAGADRLSADDVAMAVDCRKQHDSP